MEVKEEEEEEEGEELKVVSTWSARRKDEHFHMAASCDPPAPPSAGSAAAKDFRRRFLVTSSKPINPLTLLSAPRKFGNALVKRNLEEKPSSSSASKESSSSKEPITTKKLKLESKEEKLPKRKPLKICRVKERTRIGLAAATLEELRTKIQAKFPSPRDFKIVLEEDCTRIDDEDYFKTLPDNTVLMVVTEGEQWTRASSSLEEEFSTGYVEVDGKMTQEETSRRLAKVAGRIAENPAILAFLPKVDLEIMADADLNELQVLLYQTKDKAEFIQDACERRLSDMIASDEAIELLKLYHRVKTTKGETLSQSEEGGSLSKMEEGRSLSQTEEGRSLSKTEEGGSLSQTEEGGSLSKTEEGRSLSKTEESRLPKRVTRSTRKKAKFTF
ncbi:uncharacterized protein [Asterias amurensis]|uniref:uncharacterized protein isoform X2 n=1 Tax=Asterias amurensis TaxID=7602 RepID=UPI003AB453C3